MIVYYYILAHFIFFLYNKGVTIHFYTQNTLNRTKYQCLDKKVFKKLVN